MTPTTTQTKPRAAEVASMLNSIPLPLPYDVWIRVCMGVFDAHPNETGQQLVVDWSGDYFKPGENPHRVMEAKWKSFTGTAVSVGTLIHIAKSYGWERPAQLPTWKPSPPRAVIARPDDQPPSGDWQEAASFAVIACATALQQGYATGKGTAGKAAQWLDQRGIDADTAALWGLGFNPAWCNVGAQRLAPGIVIPGYGPSPNGTALWYVKVRVDRKTRNGSGQKYLSLKGSQSNVLYNAEATLKARRVVVVEGEFDCILLSRYAPPDTAVVTKGAAKQYPSRYWLGYIAAHNNAAVFQDGDETGQSSAAGWLTRFPTAQQLTLPGEMDVTDYWKSGGDLSAWLAG